MRVLVAAVALVAGCGEDEPAVLPPDAPLPAPDAPFECTPATEGPVCLALAPARFSGSTPLGTLAADLAYAGAGDCITISQAVLSSVGACGEQVSLRFPYPVRSGADGKRYVASSFDTDATLQLSTFEDVTTIHVDVVVWQEGEGAHDIDITVTFTEPGYTVTPIHVQGTFCDWAYWLC